MCSAFITVQDEELRQTRHDGLLGEVDVFYPTLHSCGFKSRNTGSKIIDKFYSLFGSETSQTVTCIHIKNSCLAVFLSHIDANLETSQS